MLSRLRLVRRESFIKVENRLGDKPLGIEKRRLPTFVGDFAGLKASRTWNRSSADLCGE
jgi:hypothetical protein